MFEPNTVSSMLVQTFAIHELAQPEIDLNVEPAFGWQFDIVRDLHKLWPNCHVSVLFIWDHLKDKFSQRAMSECVVP